MKATYKAEKSGEITTLELPGAREVLYRLPERDVNILLNILVKCFSKALVIFNPDRVFLS